jgi:hypothetical protein
LKERPRLPLAIARFIDTDVLFVRDSSSIEMNKIVDLLKARDVLFLNTPSHLFSRFILGLPMSDGSAVHHAYVLVQDTSAIERLVSEESVHFTLFASIVGPVIVVAKSDALGMDSVDISETHLPDILLKRSIDGIIRSIEVDNAAK